MANFEDLRKKTAVGFLWQFVEKSSTQFVGFFISIILARLLEPDEYGVIALTMVFMNIANVIAISGLGTSLIQKKDADELDFSTMFYVGLIISIVIYVLLFISAPLAGKLYHNDLVTDVLRVLGLSLPVASVNSIQQAYVSRRMDFKIFFYANLLSLIITGVMGIYMAYDGYGVWALVGMQLCNIVVRTIFLFILVRWYPKLIFSLERFKGLYLYGVQLTGSELLGSIFNELKSLVIGVKYKPADLAFFNRGDSLPSMISSNVNNTINTVLFPAISQVQDNKLDVKRAIRRSMMISSFVMVPLMIFLAASANNVVLFLFTEKWLPCVPFMQVLCLNYCVGVLGNANIQALKAVGRSDIVLKLEFIKKPLFLIMVLLTMTISPLAIAIGNLIYGVIAVAINAWPNKKILEYTLTEQINDIKSPFLISVVLFAVVYSVGIVCENIYLSLILQFILGALTYYVLSKKLSNENFSYILSAVKSLRS